MPRSVSPKCPRMVCAHAAQVVGRIEAAVVDDRGLDAEVVLGHLVRPAAAEAPAHRGDAGRVHLALEAGQVAHRLLQVGEGRLRVLAHAAGQPARAVPVRRDLAVVEIHRQRDVAQLGERTRVLPDVVVEPPPLVDQDQPGAGLLVGGLGQVALDLVVALVIRHVRGGDLHGLRVDRAGRHVGGKHHEHRPDERLAKLHVFLLCDERKRAAVRLAFPADVSRSR